MDRLKNMALFVEVVNEGSFTAAAEKASLSRAQVSKSIMQLEEHLGTRLLNRTTRRISLTEIGHIYYERCIAILHDIEKIEELIIERAQGNPFIGDLRPSITSEPSLNRAQWLRSDLLKLEFVYADKTYLIEENYEIREIRPTRRAAILIRLLKNTPFVIESRASFKKSQYLHRTVANILGIDIYILEFTDVEIEDIKRCLNAKKKAARHKKSAGDFDTVEVSASPQLDDLDNSQEYQQLLSGDELKKARYKFVYTTNSGSLLDVTIYISKRGSIWFVSEVPEEVIDYVFSCVRRIKGI